MKSRLLVTRSNAVILTALLVLFASLSARAGGAFNGGGGGQGVLCVDTQSGAKSLQLLDLYEWNLIHPNQPTKKGTGYLRNDLESIFQRLKYSISKISGLKRTEGPDDLIDLLRSRSEPFLNPTGTNVIRVRGNKISSTGDDYAITWPANCSIEQIVSYQNGEVIYLNQDLFDLLDETNQAALIAHEALYAALRIIDNESNSIRVRRAIGFVSSGQAFSESKVEMPNHVLECTTGLFPDFDTIIDMWISNEKNEIGTSSNLNFFPQKIYGNQLMGLDFRNAKIPLKTEVPRTLKFSNVCKGLNRSMSGVWWNLMGPIEFDRLINFTVACDGNKPVISVKATVPGQLAAQSAALTCVEKTVR